MIFGLGVILAGSCFVTGSGKAYGCDFGDQSCSDGSTPWFDGSVSTSDSGSDYSVSASDAYRSAGDAAGAGGGFVPVVSGVPLAGALPAGASGPVVRKTG